MVGRGQIQSFMLNQIEPNNGKHPDGLVSLVTTIGLKLNKSLEMQENKILTNRADTLPDKKEDEVYKRCTYDHPVTMILCLQSNVGIITVIKYE